MSRSPLSTHRSLLFCFLIALFSGMAVADDDEKKAEVEDDADSAIPGVARSLGYAWESFEAYFEIASAHGARGEIAWRRIQVDAERSRVLQEVQDGDALVSTWPQNRYHWSVQQLNDFNALQRHRQYMNSLEANMRDLDRCWAVLDEAARRQAQFKGKEAIPLDREGLLREFQRLGDKKLRAYIAAKLAVREAAEESKQTPTVVLKKAAAQISSSTANPQTLKPFIAEFKAFYGKSKDRRVTSRKPSRAATKPSRAATKPSRPADKKKPVEPLNED